MQPFFSDWYRICSVEFNEDVLQKRWAGVEAFIKAIDSQNILELVRVINRKPPKKPDFKDTFRQAFKTADATFTMSGNDLELEVLASMVLAQCILAPSKYATIAALSIVCADYQGITNKISIPELLNICTKHLRQEAVDARRISGDPVGEIPNFKKADVVSAVKTGLASGSHDTSSQAIVDQMEKFVKPMIKTFNELSRQIEVQREETDVLWWLLGEFSNDEQKPFAKIDMPARCLVAAKELSDRTIFLPGLFATEAFLSKVLHAGDYKEKDMTIKNAINSVSSEWRKNSIKENEFNDIIDLCPIHYAVMKAEESGDANAWVQFFENNTRLKAGEPVKPLTISLQVYNEYMLAKCIAEYN